MAGELKLTFDMRMEGDEQVSRAFRRITSDCNAMPKAAQEGLTAINSNISSIIKALDHLSTVTVALGNDNDGLSKAFGAGQVVLIKNLRREIEDLGREIVSLTQKTDEWAKVKAKADKRGLVGPSDYATSQMVETGLQLAAAQDRTRTAEDKIQSIISPPPPPTPPPASSGTGGTDGPGPVSHLMNMMGLGRFVGLSGPAAAMAAAALAVPLLASQLSTGPARAAIAQRGYEVSAADEAIYQNDPTRAIARQHGIGPEAGMLRGDISHKIMMSLNAVRNLAITPDAISASNFQYAQQMSNLSKEQLAEVTRVANFRQRVGSETLLSQQQFGIDDTSRMIGSMSGMGSDLTTSSAAMNMISRYGGTPIMTDALMGLAPERFGISGSILDQIARTESFRGRASPGPFGIRTHNAAMSDVMSLVGQAGLGNRSDIAARTPFTDLISQHLQSMDFVGESSIADMAGSLAGGVGAARRGSPNAAGVDVVRLAGQQFSTADQALRSGFDPHRTVAMSTMMNQGLTATEADAAITRGLYLGTTQTGINKLAMERTGRKIDFKSLLGAANEELYQGVKESLYQPGVMDPSFDKAMGDQEGSAAQRIWYQTRGAAAAKIKRDAELGMNQPGIGGKVEEAQETIEKQQRDQRAGVDKELAAAVIKMGPIFKDALAPSAGIIASKIDQVIVLLGGSPAGKLSKPARVNGGNANRGGLTGPEY